MVKGEETEVLILLSTNMLSHEKAQINSDEAAQQWLEISCRDPELQKHLLSSSTKLNWRANRYSNYRLFTAILIKQSQLHDLCYFVIVLVKR